jgi:hypothetical protein
VVVRRALPLPLLAMALSTGRFVPSNRTIPDEIALAERDSGGLCNGL